MLTAVDSNKNKLIAWETEKDQKPFFCPECGGELNLRKGRIRIHHFSHIPPFDCQYGQGETQQHYLVKQQIYLSLNKRTNTSKCELERQLEEVRPDVSLYIGRTPVAIEVQKSTIDVREITRRMKVYNKLKIFVIWVLPESVPSLEYHENEAAYVHRLKKWELYLHTLAFGRVYFWQVAATVRAYHFNPFKIYKQESTWYSPDGEEMSAGGYDYYAKTLKKPLKLSRDLDIADDFKFFHKKESYSYSGSEIPECRIWIDKESKWW
ncbi:MAG: competence protein CoiA family protein [Candidatus Thiodiazotropha sp.]